MIRNSSGVHSQTSTATTPMNAVDGCASTFGVPSPSDENSGLTTPMSDAYISRQITPTTTGAIVIGSSSDTRKKRENRSWSTTSSASASPSSVSIATAKNT